MGWRQALLVLLRLAADRATLQACRRLLGTTANSQCAAAITQQQPVDLLLRHCCCCCLSGGGRLLPLVHHRCRTADAAAVCLLLRGSSRVCGG